MYKYVGIGETATVFRVSVSTPRRWDASGKLEAETTPGGYRRFDLAKLWLDLFHAANDIQRKAIAYACVSSQRPKKPIWKGKGRFCNCFAPGRAGHLKLLPSL